MEEQKKEEMEVTDAQKAEDTAGDNGSDSEQEAPAGMPTRSLMLWVLAGIYLVYTGYRLCKNVIDGVEGASIGFMLSGIVFLVIGGGLLFFGLRGVYRADRLKKAQEAAANAQGGSKPEPKAVATVKEDGRKSMSIAERARLAGRLEEETEDSEDTDIEITDLEGRDSEE